jgi:hypothetical protein
MSHHRNPARVALNMATSLAPALAVVLCLLTASAGYAGTHADDGSVTNKDIVDLQTGGFSEDVLFLVVSASPSAFSVLPQDLVALRDSGLSDDVLLAMISAARAGQPANRSDDPSAKKQSNDDPSAEKPICHYGLGTYSHGACLGGQRCYDGEWLPYDRCRTEGGGGSGGSGGGGTNLDDLCQRCGCCYRK